MDIDLENIVLSSGAHGSHEEGHCLLEVVSMFAGDDFGDSPACVDRRSYKHPRMSCFRA